MVTWNGQTLSIEDSQLRRVFERYWQYVSQPSRCRIELNGWPDDEIVHFACTRVGVNSYFGIILLNADWTGCASTVAAESDRVELGKWFRRMGVPVLRIGQACPVGLTWYEFSKGKEY